MIVQSFDIPGVTQTCGVAIAADGTILASNLFAGPEARYAIYANRRLTPLPSVQVPAGFYDFILTGINSAHTVIGYFHQFGGGPDGERDQAFKLVNGMVMPIAGLSALSNAVPNAINDLGFIVGVYQRTHHAGGFVASSRRVTILDTGINPTFATAINQSGTLIAGVSVTTRPVPYSVSRSVQGEQIVPAGREKWMPWLYRDGRFEHLSAPAGESVEPKGIYGGDTVVGNFQVRGTSHGFRTINGHPTIFDVPNARETMVMGANERGQITGCYVNHTGKHGYIAMPL